MSALDGDKIRAAMRAARLLGWRIKDDVTVEPRARQCCPIGACYVVEHGAPMLYVDLDEVARTLRLSIDEVASFAVGFDGETPDNARDNAAYQLGALIRHEMLLDEQDAPAVLS